jgi:uncharacterized protein YbjT (DUF2867 family)
MKVVVIGATGRTGRHVVKRLLEAGDDLTAFVRNQDALGLAAGRVKIVQGDSRDAAAVDAAVAGQDAVLMAFGPRSLKKVPCRRPRCET